MLRVAVPSPIRDCLDYLPPEAGPAAPPPGVRVRVPLGRRSVVGVVVAHAAQSALPRERLRPVTAVLDRSPVLPPELLALAAWMTDYYQHPPGEVFALFLPPAVRRGETTAGPRERIWTVTEAGRGAELPRAPARRRALDALAARGGVATTAELAADGVRPETLRQLARDGLVEAGERPRSPPGSAPAAPAPALAPTPEQAAALDAVARAGDRFAPFLLEGVTGSGKTEVYLGLARRVLDAGRQVLLLVPEIGLTPQTLARVRARFPEPVAVLHSGLAAGARLAAWRDAASGRARILVGTR
ncbi:MAG: DEAD/DEAH box helicase family protein, partial [Pseudomonadales bacterium]|nr:DEAD/DEAH box helicase family protein [Pseudomonadales bacterium]